MRIKHITIKDWGPHKEIDEDTDASIVGIIGSNGKGKSNLLQALDFCLNGNLNKQNKELYIRNFGMENGAKKAYVSIEFEKNGITGTITREINKGSTKRLLVWDNVEYKSDSEVSSKMLEILGADKNAMANAVFIKQGDITNLIKGTPAVRQEIFQKLMKLSFLNSRDIDLKVAADNISKGVVDMSPIIDNYKSRIKDLEDSINSNLQYISNTKDRKDDINLLNIVLRTMESIADRACLINNLKAEIQALKSSTESLSKDKMEHLQKKLDEANTEADKFRKILDDKQNLDACKSALLNASKRVDEIEQKIPQLKDSLEGESEYTDELIKVREEKEVLLAYEKAKSDYEASKTNLDNIKIEMSDILTDYVNKTETFAAELEKLNTEELSCVEKRGINRCRVTFYSNTSSNATECPICGSNYVHNDNIESELKKASDELQKAETRIKEIKKAKQAIENEKEKLSKKVAEVTSRSEQLEQIVHEVETKFREAKIPKSCNRHDLDVREHWLSDRLTDISRNKIELGKLESQLKPYQEQVKQLKETIDKFSKNCDTSRSDLEVYLRIWENSAKTYKRQIDSANVCNGKIEALEKQINSLIYKQNDDKKYLDQVEHDAQMVDLFFGEGYVDSDKVRLKIEELQSEQNKREAYIISYGERTKSKVELDKALQEAVDKQNKNQKILDIAADLNTVRRIISNKGLPMSYMNAVFNSMTEDVQNMLSKMGANFTVFPDEERPLTYKFMRTDSADEYYMPQELLSGGQAVRLALALLIACQQTVLPDVGLLVLDEPSSHLDADGVDSLQDLFKSLSITLNSSDMQIFVVDHSEPLCGAFEKLIKL